MSRRYRAMFDRLAAREAGALVPFLMLGDPDPDTCLARIEEAVAAGADALELGIPFSDPVADGPVIVAAAGRARAAGATPARCFALLRRVRARHPDLPLGLLVYANTVFARGIDAFHADGAESGIDSVLVADLPLREAAPFRAASCKHGIASVFILPPDADAATLSAVAAASHGYTYVLGRAGVTGTERAPVMPDRDRLARLKLAGAPPPLIGFGISRPEHARAALAAGAAGVIVGSAMVHCHASGGDASRLLRALRAALDGPVLAS